MAKKTVDLGYKPRGWQARVHRERERFSVLVLHRRAGKTVFSVMELYLGDPARGIKGALNTPNGRFAYIAPFYAQAKAVAWDLVKQVALKIPGAVIRESELKVELPNGASIRLFGADNPNALRGLGFDGVVVDEVADIEPGVWGEVVRPALADRRGWALFIGTAKGVNLFSELFYKAERGDEGYEGWYAKRLTVYETDDSLHPDEVAAAKRDMTPAQFRAEMMCEFDAGGVDTLIPGDLVEAATRRGVAESQYAHCGVALGVDPARFGDDSTAFMVRRGPVAYGLQRVHGYDTMEVADLAVQLADEHGADMIFVDEGGLGAGVLDRLRQLGRYAVGVNFGSRSPNPKYANQRARLWGDMADWLKFGCLPDDLRLKVDLSAPTFKFDAQHRIVLESKAEMKKRGLASPDAGDALALTFYAPLPSRSDGRREQMNRCDGVEYDLFAGE